MQAVERFATSPIAWHNYAATLGDLGRAEEAVDGLREGVSLGLDAPETLGVYARALRAAGDHAARRLRLPPEPDARAGRDRRGR